MRRLALPVALAFTVAWLAWASSARSVPRPTPHTETTTVAPAGPLYDPDPQHLWNRVDRHLRIRTSDDGSEHGADALDPVLWRETRHLLTPPSHEAAIAVLDEFLAANAETLVSDPVKRAIFQRDLWAVFDWAVGTTHAHGPARRALAARLARIIRRIALTPEQIEALPDTYAAAVTARRFPREYDAARRELAFLPTRLLESGGPWVAIHGSVPVAQHSDEMSRSDFGVYLTLPGGRPATLAYLRMLWETKDPFMVDPIGSLGTRESRTTIRQDLWPLPTGTKVALVRRMLLIDPSGEIRRTRLVESVQMRVFREAERCRSVSCGANDQDFFEFVLDRSGLFAATARGLRALAPDDRAFLTFSSHGIDWFEVKSESGRPRQLRHRPLEGCVNCHNEPGLASVRTARRLFKPFTFADTGGPGGEGMPDFWKSQRADWGWLQSLWLSEPR